MDVLAGPADCAAGRSQRDQSAGEPARRPTGHPPLCHPGPAGTPVHDAAGRPAHDPAGRPGHDAAGPCPSAAAVHAGAGSHVHREWRHRLSDGSDSGSDAAATATGGDIFWSKRTESENITTFFYDGHE